MLESSRGYRGCRGGWKTLRTERLAISASVRVVAESKGGRYKSQGAGTEARPLQLQENF
jgi:hypothetical protein